MNWRRRIGTGLVLALVAALPAPPAARQGWAQMKSDLPRLGSAGGDDLSPIAERRLGEQIMRELRRERAIDDDAEVTQFLNSFGAELISSRSAVGQDVEFFLVKDSSINAFALPGGFIGVHSGLITNAQTESQLAGVLAHEIGHVSQRHIARMLAEEKQTSVLALAGLVLAALAARSSPDAALGLATLGQSVAMRQMLGFSRDAEREADRIGLETLSAAGFDPNGMVEFFSRLRSANMIRESNVPAYFRTHPLDSERIADMQNRLRDLRYRQRPDGLTFRLARAKLKALADLSIDGLRDARTSFEQQLKSATGAADPANWYGLAVIALEQRDEPLVEHALGEFRKLVPESHPFAERLLVDAKLVAKDRVGAQATLAQARQKFPGARALRHAQARVLLAGTDPKAAVSFLSDQVSLDRSDPTLWKMLSEAQSAAGDLAQAHRAAAEQFVLLGALGAAIDQLQLAQRAPRGDFQSQSVIDSRLRELRDEYAREQRENGVRRRNLK